MRQRNVMCPNQMIDMELDQQAQSNVHPEPCVLLGGIPNFPQPNVRTILPTAGNTANFAIHHLPDGHENALFYCMSQYNVFQHHPSRNLDLGSSASTHYYNPYMFPPGLRVFPLPINQGSHSHFPSSSNGIGVPTDDYRGNHHFSDGSGFLFKRKTEGGAPSFQYGNASASSSSAVAPLNTRPFEPEVTLMDAALFPLPEYRGNDVSSVMEVSSQRNTRNISGAIGLDSGLANNPNHFIQANYPTQAFLTASLPWFDQQFTRNDCDGGTFTWSQAPAFTYLHGNMDAHGYQETIRGGSSTTFLHLPHIHQGHPSLYQQSQHRQGLRGQSINLHSQLPTPSHRPSTNTMNPFQDGVEVGPRYMGHGQPTGLRIHRPHRRALMPDATMRDLPHLRVLHTDEVAILEIPDYHEVRNPTDHHRNMRLDIDHMSYEELLALGEQIGNVSTGLSEDTIFGSMKSRTYMNLDEAACTDLETDFCVVCQTDYKNQDMVGKLGCGHEYHVDCIKRWLLIKNTCPICKTAVLATERKDLRREGR